MIVENDIADEICAITRKICWLPLEMLSKIKIANFLFKTHQTKVLQGQKGLAFGKVVKVWLECSATVGSEARQEKGER